MGVSKEREEKVEETKRKVKKKKVNKLQSKKPGEIRQTCDNIRKRERKEDLIQKAENEQQQDTEEEGRDMKEKKTWPE